MEIKPYAKNAKLHPKEQIEQLARAIEAFGFSPAIEVDADGTIVSGHGRWMAATQNLGWTETAFGSHRSGKGVQVIPIIVLTDLSADEIKAKRLADNKLAETDVDMLLAIEELRELDMSGLDIELTGYSKDLILDPDEKDDSVPVVPNDPRSQVGDIYLLGDHTIMCGDSTSALDVERLMSRGGKAEGLKADMVFTDPPYNVNYKGTGEKTSSTILNDKMSHEEFDVFLDHTFERYAEVTKEGGALYVFHSSSTQNDFEKALNKNGYQVIQQLIWNKPGMSLGWSDYRWKHEPFFYAGRKGVKPQFYGDRAQSTVWDFTKNDQELLNFAKRIKNAERNGKTSIWTMKRENTQEYVHPTQKPVELITYALENSSKRGDIVLDLFMGSGATLIAAEKTGRIGFGMELDCRYVDVIVSRYVEYTGNNKIIKNGEEIEWDTETSDIS